MSIGKVNAMKRLQIMKTLSDFKIPFSVVEHPPAATIEEIDHFNLPNSQAIVKNLFLRDDKKKNYYLMVVNKNKTVNLKELRNLLGSRPLSFASEADLQCYLGLKKGEVTPLGLLNDADCRVCLVLDRDIMAYPVVGVHPNENTATLWLSPFDLRMLIEKHGNAVITLKI